MAAQNPFDEGRTYMLRVNPGIARDGTTFAGKSWIDGQWCRFQRALPRKIGGYDSIITGLNNVPRGMELVNNSPNFNLFIGDFESLKYWTIDQNGNIIAGPIDVTPAAFVQNPNYIWTFDTMFSTVDNSNILIAYPGANLAQIDSTLETPVFFGNPTAAVPFAPTGQITSGGVVVLHPFIFYFGNAGDVSWSNANDPTTIMDDARVTGSKIIQGFATRGGNSSPAGLLWSLDSVIRITQTGTSAIEFTFDTVTNQSSILSSSSVIEYDSKYFWTGVDRFLFYNGVVGEIPNNMNLNYFFNNLNYNQRQKVWVTKITEFGEIWWHYPRTGNDECNAAIIYNIRENTWYDTFISRGCGLFDQTFAQPIWADNNELGDNIIWLQEEATDQIVDGVHTAIPFACETSYLSYCAVAPDGNTPGLDRWIDIYRLEPDGIQAGNMQLIVNGRKYARSTVQSSDPFTFGTDQEKIDIREQRREMTLRFLSNSVGADFQMGQILMVMRVGDARQ